MMMVKMILMVNSFVILGVVYEDITLNPSKFWCTNFQQNFDGVICNEIAVLVLLD